MIQEHNPSDVLLYLISESGTSTDRLKGRKKLMKLAFFAEHLDPSSDEMTPDQNVGSFDFEIFKYGPFSRDVLDAFDDLQMNRYIHEDDDPMEHIITLTEEGQSRVGDVEDELPREVKEQISTIAKTFGEQSGRELENASLDHLGITKQEKEQLRGKDVERIITSGS